MIYLVLNTFTTALVSFVYAYYKNKDLQDTKINILLKRIENLEEKLTVLQQSIENIEEDINYKNKVIESNIALNSKLEDFINYNYEMGE